MQHIHTLSLRGNHLQSLKQLHNLALHLLHITALDLSANEGIAHFKELEILVGRSEGPGLAPKVGGLKELQEIKLEGTALRERSLKEGSEKTYFR